MRRLLVSVLFLFHSLQIQAYPSNNINPREKPGSLVDRSDKPTTTPDSQPNEALYENDGVHLAVQPICTTLDKPGEINTGVEWSSIKTVVVFGDSYTQVGNGGTGSPPSSIRFVGKDPSAGGRNTNGPTWIEQLLHFEEDEEHPRTLISFAKSGATTDKEIWQSRKWGDDFPSQLSRFYANSTNLQLDPTSTLYVGYFGINDYRSISADGDQMRKAGRRAAELIKELHHTVDVRNILWLGLQFSTPSTEAYNRAIYASLLSLQYSDPTFAFTYVSTAPFFSSIHESFETFGYTSWKPCLEGQRSSIEDECEDPERTVYYLGMNPSRQTHRILAEYVMGTMKGCYLFDQQSYQSLTAYRMTLTDPLGDYISTMQLYILSFLFVSVLVYKPLLKTARKFGFGTAAIVLTSPRQPQP